MTKFENDTLLTLLRMKAKELGTGTQREREESDRALKLLGYIATIESMKGSE